MTTTKRTYVVDEIIAPGLRYREEVGGTEESLPVRYCYLFQEGEDEPVSELGVLSFEQRFGEIAVPAEGIGGVETPPQFRRQGYVRRLVTRATESMAQRVHVAFVGDAIEGLYEKFGYISCLAEGHLALNVRQVEQMLEQNPLPLDNRTLRISRPDDLPSMVNLYNRVHAYRPWTHARHREWNRLVPAATWKPGSTVLVLLDSDELVGYAIFKEQYFGRPAPALSVDELTAGDSAAAYRLLAELAQRCWEFRLSQFVVHEPLDSLVGSVARQIGCEYHQRFPITGGMMGAILHREPLLAALEPELRRRLPGEDHLAAHREAFAALGQGELIADNGMLLRLLLGYWSIADALAVGLSVPPQWASLCAAWFPGGGTQSLPVPYAHKLDRY